jgi:hypothetical protein
MEIVAEEEIETWPKDVWEGEFELMANTARIELNHFKTFLACK